MRVTKTFSASPRSRVSIKALVSILIAEADTDEVPNKAANMIGFENIIFLSFVILF